MEKKLKVSPDGNRKAGSEEQTHLNEDVLVISLDADVALHQVGSVDVEDALVVSPLLQSLGQLAVRFVLRQGRDTIASKKNARIKRGGMALRGCPHLGVEPLALLFIVVILVFIGGYENVHQLGILVGEALDVGVNCVIYERPA